MGVLAWFRKQLDTIVKYVDVPVVGEREEDDATSLLDTTAGLTAITTTTTKPKRVVFLLWFGNVTVPLIYMNLTAYDLACCCLVCRTMNRELVVIAEHLVNILHAKYFAISIKSGVSPRVRVIIQIKWPLQTRNPSTLCK